MATHAATERGLELKAAVIFVLAAACAAQAAQVDVTIRLSPLDAGQTIPVQGSHSVNASEKYLLSVTPNSGYVFKSWSASSGAIVATATAATTTFSATYDSAIVANFESNIDSVFLNLSTYPAAGGGTLVPAAGKHKYHVGDQLIIKAVPSSSYRFARWQAFGKATIEDKWAAETNLVMGGDGRAVAVFMPVAATTNYTSFNSPFNVGSISPAGTNSATVGAAIAVAATADTGFKFIRWEVDGYGSVANASYGSTKATFHGPSRLTAHFAPDPALVFKIAGINFAVSPADCGASTNPAPGSYNYFIGDALGISTSIDPDSGYSFLRWDLDGQGLLDYRRSPDANVVFYNDCDLTAVYVPSDQIATLTLAYWGEGAVYPSQSVSVQTDTDFAIRATPKGGHFFACWSVDDADSDKVTFANRLAADTSVRLTASATVTAKFIPQSIWLDRSLPYITINLNTLKGNTDNINVDRALLLNQKTDFDAAGYAVVVVDGASFYFDIATAVPTDVGYTLTTADPPRHALPQLRQQRLVFPRQ